MVAMTAGSRLTACRRGRGPKFRVGTTGLQCPGPMPGLLEVNGEALVYPTHSAFSRFPKPWRPGKEEFVATFKGNEFFCYDLSHNPIQSSTDEITLAFRTLQRNGLMLHTGKSADYVNLSLKSGAVWLVINLGSGAFEALVEPVNGKFNDNAWHDVRVTRNLRQVGGAGRRPGISFIWGRTYMEDRGMSWVGVGESRAGQ